MNAKMDKTINKKKGARNSGKKKNGYRPNKADERGQFGSEISASTNDPSWYSKNPVLARAAGQLSYANLLGLPVTLGTSTSEGAISTGITLPGIMVMKYAPGIGVSTNGASSVNVNARLVYSWIRHWNSGSRNYEAPDLMMMLMAMGSAYAYYAELVRVYGLFRVFDPTNRYISKPLIEALGFDYDDISANLASFRYYINSYAVRINSIATPKSLTFFDRMAWMPMHIFKDSKTVKAQLYAFRPEYYFRFDGTTKDTGSALEPYYVPNGLRTLTDVMNFGDNLIEALLTNEDIGIMSGDILKAFKDSGIRALAAVEENYSTVPVYDEMVLSQIHNAFITDGWDPDEVESLWVTQDNGSILWDPIFKFSKPNSLAADFKWTQIVDSGMDDPTPEFNMEATRLKVVPLYSYAHDSYNCSYLRSCGTEIITACEMYNLDPTEGDLSSPVLLKNTAKDEATGTVYTGSSLSDVWRMYFDWHPITYRAIFDNMKAPSNLSVYPEGELFNYAVISDDTLTKLHTVAQQSLFQIPEMVHSI